MIISKREFAKRTTTFNVAYVTCKSERNFQEEDRHFWEFFQLDQKKLILYTVDEMAKLFGASLDPLSFLDQLIPNEREMTQVEIAPTTCITAIQKTTVKVPIVESEPKNSFIDGIITELNLKKNSYSKKNMPHGLGIVAWAVQHSIPVGLIVEQDKHDHEAFWWMSVIDTLRNDPRCSGNNIPTGDVREVCYEMRELLLKPFNFSIQNNTGEFDQ